MKKIKLMVIDDNEEFIANVKESYFGDEEVEVIGSAQDGLDAIHKIETFNPDVVILDLIMPEVDGFGVLANIDYSKMTKKPNFIIASQLIGENFINKAITLGASYYLVKPVEGSTELNNADQITVPMANMNSLPEVGDILENVYDGLIAESYPAQITNVYSISVVE